MGQSFYFPLPAPVKTTTTAPAKTTTTTTPAKTTTTTTPAKTTTPEPAPVVKSTPAPAPVPQAKVEKTQFTDLTVNAPGTYTGEIAVAEGLENVYDEATSKTLMTSENQVLSDIIKFNQLYTDYLECKTLNLNNMSNCSAQAQKLSDLKTQLNSEITPLSGEITSGTKKEILTYEELQRAYKTNVATRSELDVKLNELYRNKDSITNEYKKHYDSTMYSGILLSALATSILYYIFVKVN
jgi:3-oxoacyl-ACP reductase-like protein